jgi:fatty-acyl-CoA synthase
MKINIYDEDADAVKISVSGRIDSNTYQELQNAVNEADYSKGSLIFDFKDVEYISSAGLRVLLSARKKIGAGSMKVINVSSIVFETFEMTGFDSIFDVTQGEEGIATYISLSFKEILKMKLKKNSDVTVLSHLGSDYTWKDIEMYSQIVANDLFKTGVTKGSHVGICSANSANWIITFLAVQKLGAIACLLNFNYNEKEIADVSKVGDITHLCYGDIATMKDKDKFLSNIKNAENNKITEFYDIRSSIDFKERKGEYDSVKGLFDVKVESDDACVMIYTSGSTGKPKGVLLSAYNILNASAAMADEIMITNEDKLCLIVPMFHIMGMTTGLFCNLLKNALIVIPENIRTGTILSTIDTYKCTLFHSVPTMVLAIMNNKEFSSDKVSSLRCTILAGAAATEAQIIKMNEIFPNNHFVCAYGLSEMAPVSLTKYDDTIEHIAKTVGKPVNNIQISVKNHETGGDCAVGEVGEITVEGYNLMSCYYKAALDMQSIDDSGWLHTGDLGFLDEDGYLHLTGRAKELIIRGGENIMPSEIAEVISQFPDVADVKVQGVPDDFFGEVVGASVVMKDGKQLDTDKLKAFLAERLAKYKLPAYIFRYDAFPLLSNGKVDAVSLKKDMNAKAAALKNKEKPQ